MDKINWFPGHMQVATKKIIESTKNVDLILQVVDARAIKTSSNFQLLKEINKPHITVAIKKDLADLSNMKDSGYLFVSIKDSSDRQKLINYFYKYFQEKINKFKNKGLLLPTFNIMIIGLPNIGKSSLINFLSQKNQTQVQNKPGLTRSQQLLKINNNFYLYDTPGIFLKNVSNLQEGYILALLQTVPKHVLNLDNINEFAFQFYSKKYNQQFCQYFQLQERQLDYSKFQNLVGKKMGFLRNENQVDFHRLNDYLFKVFSDNKICKVNYDY